jgi:hypothetical protein
VFDDLVDPVILRDLDNQAYAKRMERTADSRSLLQASQAGRSTVFKAQLNTRTRGPLEPCPYASHARVKLTDMDYNRGRMRASDSDRQEVLDRLRGALDEGRLKMDEYLERMESASEAMTYGELMPICDDLPQTKSPALKNAAAPARKPAPAIDTRGFFGSLPLPLKILWFIWGSVVALNVVIYVLVAATAGHGVYPWPLWVAGPWGVVLLAVSTGVRALGKGHQHKPQPPQLPPG